eukprot:7401859-Pyramimonas_sp.AAC.1
MLNCLKTWGPQLPRRACPKRALPLDLKKILGGRLGVRSRSRRARGGLVGRALRGGREDFFCAGALLILGAFWRLLQWGIARNCFGMGRGGNWRDTGGPGRARDAL